MNGLETTRVCNASQKLRYKRLHKLYNHASNILPTVILNRLKEKVEMELSDCQAGNSNERGTTYMLYMLQLYIENIRNTALKIRHSSAS